MDNDNQVGRDVARVKDLFLAETFGTQVKPPESYSVELEFAKAKKNRSPVVTLTVLAFVVLFVAAAAVTTLLIQRSTQRVVFDIDEFQDVNLTEILDVQKRNENALETALRELAALKKERDVQIEAVHSDIAGKIELVNNQPLSYTTRQNRITDLRTEEDQLIAAVHRKYDPLIAAKQEEIETIQARIDEYDARIKKQAKRTEERLNSQQQLYDIQTKKLTDYYENRITEITSQAKKDKAELIRQKDELVALLRRNHAAELNRQFSLYNPTFEEPAVATILDRNLYPPKADLSMLPPYRSLLQSESILSPHSFRELRTSLFDFQTILTRLEQVPYKNSIPEAFRTLRELETIIVTKYEYLWTDLVTNIKTKNDMIAEQKSTIRDQADLIDRYVYAVDFLARDSHENGYVLDARNTKNMLIRINPSIPVRDGSIGYVFREVDDYIAEIRVYTDHAELVELAAPNRTIQPFDIFLIQLQ